MGLFGTGTRAATWCLFDPNPRAYVQRAMELPGLRWVHVNVDRSTKQLRIGGVTVPIEVPPHVLGGTD